MGYCWVLQRRLACEKAAINSFWAIEHAGKACSFVTGQQLSFLSKYGKYDLWKSSCYNMFLRKLIKKILFLSTDDTLGAAQSHLQHLWCIWVNKENDTEKVVGQKTNCRFENNLYTFLLLGSLSFLSACPSVSPLLLPHLCHVCACAAHTRK